MQATSGSPVLLGGGDGQPGLGGVGHGFHDNAVGPRGGHRRGLFGETGPQFAWLTSPIMSITPAGTDGGEDFRPDWPRRGGNLHADAIDFRHAMG